MTQTNRFAIWKHHHETMYHIWEVEKFLCCQLILIGSVWLQSKKVGCSFSLVCNLIKKKPHFVKLKVEMRNSKLPQGHRVRLVFYPLRFINFLNFMLIRSSSCWKLYVMRERCLLSPKLEPVHDKVSSDTFLRTSINDRAKLVLSFDVN